MIIIKKWGKVVIPVIIVSLILGVLIVTKKSALADANMTTFDKASQMFWQVKKGHEKGVKGPFSMVKATLSTSDISKKESNDNVSISGDANSSKIKKEVYLFLLSGTKLIEGQATDIKTDILSGMDQTNDYLLNVKECVQKNVEKDSNLIFLGHSLGGMVSQQLAADSDLKKDYNILNVVTYGSPLVSPFGREGTIRRLGDIRDIVPYMSLSGTILLPWQIAGLNKEDGGYGKLDIINAHRFSYGKDEVWGKYDVLGVKNGDATFTYDDSKLEFFACPIRKK